MSAMPAPALGRTTFRTSRLLDFCSRKELIAQTGHPEELWPVVALKELVDNGLDACEEARIAPVVTITVDEDGIQVADNGPGLPARTLDGVLDFSVRMSSREAYVAPDRGAQGNALKTLVAMPFVSTATRVGSSSRHSACAMTSDSPSTGSARSPSSPGTSMPRMEGTAQSCGSIGPIQLGRSCLLPRSVSSKSRATTRS